ncbi:hypothetical protein WICMUC_002721 [Wickerhamomyces mucosus]|uniref:MHD domain-containing protein n=1 Tax=Wickerhamomyces mucosus TaxID=1378264 RepID=A0A9P8PPU0_9ASCO|nr:hypothetical protein WICMUC_002721 [Wickerhamomyces mucosus]
MATIEGLYLADERDNLIFEYPTSSSSPPLKTILATIKGVSESRYKVLHNDSIIEISQSNTIYKCTQGRIVIYAYVENKRVQESLDLKTLKNHGEAEAEYKELEEHDNGDLVNQSGNANMKRNKISTTNPNFIFVFLNKILEILSQYFGTPLNPIKIEANYDVMCNLMQDMIESGYPFITDINQLKDYVPIKSSLSSKIISTTNQLAKTYTSASNVSISSIMSNSSTNSETPWRKSNIKYTNNELFLDITEEINVILSPNTSTKNKKLLNAYKLVPKVAFLKGTVEFTSHLSGMPQTQLLLNLSGHHLSTPSFHKCIDQDKWIDSEQSLLSFVPPDGKTTIMDYIIDLDQLPLSKTFKNLGLVSIDYKENLGLKATEFEITLSLNLLKTVSSLDYLRITIKTKVDENVKIIRLSHGDFQTKSKGTFEWVFDDRVSLGTSPILRGTIESASESINDTLSNSSSNDSQALKLFPQLISASYTYKGALPSGIKVESLKIIKGLGDVKPYKGVKYITKTGDFIIR